MLLTSACVLWLVTHRSDPRFVGTWAVMDSETGEETGVKITFGSFGGGLSSDDASTRIRFRWHVSDKKLVANQTEGIDGLIEGVKSFFVSLSGNKPVTNPLSNLFGEDEPYIILLAEPDRISLRESGPDSNAHTVDLRRIH